MVDLRGIVARRPFSNLGCIEAKGRGNAFSSVDWRMLRFLGTKTTYQSLTKVLPGERPWICGQKLESLGEVET